jgi:protein-tyrosine phosphatase
MIDLHLHLLPEVDDGARDLDEACRMCQMAADDGCEALVATPHQRHDLWDNRDRERLEERLQQVRDAFGTGLDLHLGAEIRIDSELLAELDPPAREPESPRATTRPLSLAGSRYLLLELDRRGPGSDPVALIHELTVGGWIPILAHPEVIHGLDDLDLAGRLVEAGALFQITAMSLTGDFGPRARTVCERYLDSGFVHFVASDAHGAGWRPPGLTRAREILARHWGEETAERLTRLHAAAVVADQLLEDR